MRVVYKSALALCLIALGFGVFTARPDLVTPEAKPVVTLSVGGLPPIEQQVLAQVEHEIIFITLLLITIMI